MHTQDIRRIGAYGTLTVTTTAAQTGTWMAIQSLWSGTTFTALTDAGDSIVGTVASLCLSHGVTIYGAFTNFTLAVGAVRAYKTKSD